MTTTDTTGTSVPAPYGPDTALVVVDVQHDFADPDGGLYVDGGDAVVPVVDAEVRAARDAGATEATELGSLLEAAEVRRVVVVGLAGDVCVRATALDARRLGYEVELPLPATAFVELEPGDGQRTVEELRAAGVTVTSRGPGASQEPVTSR